MKTIGLLSDTHGFLHPRVFDFFLACDEIWHAGDIGDIAVTDQLQAFKPLRAVYGNIDNHIIRSSFPETSIFVLEDVKVMLTHIGGYPNKYAKGIREQLILHQPKLFIAGHSHILKVIPDTKLRLLFINPGAAGMHGFHHKITFVKFQIDNGQIKNLEVFETSRNTDLAQSVNRS